MSATDDANRLRMLAIAHNDAVMTLVERVEAGTASMWDAKAVTAAFDALDASRHALRAAHFPDARALHLDSPAVIVEHADGRLERIPADEADR